MAFRREELEKIEQRYRSRQNIFVRFGYQWADENDNPQKHLSVALRNRLRELCKEVNDSLASKYKLNYASLRAQAGRPVLYKIVFDILSADVLFFDMSYHNANVFFELGIAYAANGNLFLIRRQGTSHVPPSDLAGLTYCTYSFGTRLSFDWSAEKDIKSALQKIIRRKMKLNSEG